MTTLHKAADLIDLLVARGGAMRLQDMAEALGLPRSTIHRLCGSLVDVGLLHRDGAGTYGLGPRLIGWSLASDATVDLAWMAQPRLRRLSGATGEATSLSISRGVERICIGQACAGSAAIRGHAQDARVRGLRQGAAGACRSPHHRSRL